MSGSPYMSRALGNLPISPISSSAPLFGTGFESNQELVIANRVLTERLDQLWKLYFQNKAHDADAAAEQHVQAMALQAAAVSSSSSSSSSALRDELNTSKQLINVLLQERNELIQQTNNKPTPPSVSSPSSSPSIASVDLSVRLPLNMNSNKEEEEEKEEEKEEEEEGKDTTQEIKPEGEGQRDEVMERSYKAEANALRQLKLDLDRKIDALTEKYDARVSEGHADKDSRVALQAKLLHTQEQRKAAQRERDAAVRENIDLQSTMVANRLAYEEAALRARLKQQAQLREYETVIGKLQIALGESKASNGSGGSSDGIVSGNNPGRDEERALTLRVYDLDKQRTVANEKLRRMSEALSMRDNDVARLNRDVEALSKFLSTYKSENESNQLLIRQLKTALSQTRESERLHAIELTDAHKTSRYYQAQSSQLLDAHQHDVSDITSQYAHDLDQSRHSLTLARNEVIALQGEKDALARKVRRSVLENESLRYSAEHSMRHPMRSEV
jgi:hypothetical protein